MKAKYTRIFFLLTTIILIGFSSVNAHAPIWSDSIEMDEGSKTIPLGERIDAPYSIDASDGSSNEYIYVTWDSVDGATYYEVYVYDDNDSSYLSSPVYSGSNTSYDDNSGYGGTYYYYWVKACDDSRECSGYSSPDSGWMYVDRPASVEASNGTSTYEIEVTWNTSSRAIGTAFEVWRYDDDIIGSAGLLDTVYGTSYSDETADPGKYYYYWVRACGDDEDLCSEFSEYDDGYMDVEPPTGVSASKGTYTDRVEIEWNFSTVSLYEVFRNTSDNSSTATSLGTESGPPFWDTTAEPGTIYYYWVKACGEDDICSTYSDSDSGFRLALNYHLFLPLIQK